MFTASHWQQQQQQRRRAALPPTHPPSFPHSPPSLFSGLISPIFYFFSEKYLSFSARLLDPSPFLTVSLIKIVPLFRLFSVFPPSTDFARSLHPPPPVPLPPSLPLIPPSCFSPEFHLRRRHTLYLCLQHMFTLDYKETTVNPLSDKVVSGACVCLKIFVHVLKVCARDEERES